MSHENQTKDDVNDDVNVKSIHIDMLQIVTRVCQDQDDQDEFVIHEMLREMMENGFEVDHSILKEILNEHPQMSDSIQTLKFAEKDVKRMYRELERFENQ